jgi:hypothetical protein
MWAEDHRPNVGNHIEMPDFVIAIQAPANKFNDLYLESKQVIDPLYLTRNTTDSYRFNLKLRNSFRTFEIW